MGDRGALFVSIFRVQWSKSHYITPSSSDAKIVTIFFIGPPQVILPY